ncbi:MAG TPA: hypothetical protein VFR10_09060, partial [bacterium]|nr:hypothetical protein [bacterium]
MMRLLLVAAILLSGALWSPARGQSLYSLRGFGEDIAPQPSLSRALGGTGGALAVPGIYANPAQLMFAERTTFSGTLGIDWTKTDENATGKSRQEYAFTVSNLTLIFPLTQNLVLGTGLLFDRRIDGQIETEAAIDSVAYVQVFREEGNLIRFPALLGARAGGMEFGGGIDVQLFTTKRSFQNRFDLNSG